MRTASKLPMEFLYSFLPAIAKQMSLLHFNVDTQQSSETNRHHLGSGTLKNVS